MFHDPADTIAAISSVLAPGGRGIVRVSGPAAWLTLRAIVSAETSLPSESPERAQVLRDIPLSLFDRYAFPADVFFWNAGAGYTGQETLELHTLGAPVLLQHLLTRILAAGARPAQPGEFTLRAFLSGRLDLTQAEAVLGVIEARDDGRLQTALAQLAGSLGGPLSELRDHLLDLLSELELGFDFADEDLPFVDRAVLHRSLCDALRRIEQLLAQIDHRLDADVLPTVVLAGSPNAGKSTLFNALSGSQGALVSSVPGTTRDYLEAICHSQTEDFRLIDTAGREAAAGTQSGPDPIVQSAERAAVRAAQRADLVLWCVDGSRALDEEEKRQIVSQGDASLIVLTKADLPRRTQYQRYSVAVSAFDPEAVVSLRETIGRRLAERRGCREVLPVTAVRCRDGLRRAAEALQRAGALVDEDEPVPEELLAGEIRAALEELGEVAGTVYTDDLLDRIFSRFCIGK